MKNQKVYVMEANGLVKVGIAACVKSRFDIFKIGNPRIKIVYESGFFCNAALIEAAVHKDLKSRDYWEAGEWFNCHRDEAVEKIKFFANSIGRPGKVVAPAKPSDAYAEMIKNATSFDDISNASEFARIHGLSRQVVEHRIKAGWQFGEMNGEKVMFNPKYVQHVKKGF